MTGPDHFYSDIDALDNGIGHIERGRHSDRIFVKVDSDKLLTVVTGEPTGETLLECFRAGLEQNLLRPSMRALVDLTHFTGAVDWSAVSTLRQMAPWGESGNGSSRVAYLLRDNNVASLIKIVSVLFAHTRHCAFTDRKAATAWLEIEREESPEK